MRKTPIACILAVFALAAVAEKKPLTERMAQGKEAYTAYCAGCHDTGVEDAPTLSTPEQWSERSDLWEAVLFEHAYQGYGRMPGRAGKPELQEADIEAAAEYILSVVFPDRASD